ncbi:alpha/beta hydrolase [Enterovirga rhinocerotis]|nr:alpha/beta-hydrolase family protein [Enterovirga rhinocerotis]
MLRGLFHPLSGTGLVLGTLFFAAALTPSLVPRTYLTQGALAGACLAVGYCLGVAARWLWTYLELPEPAERIRRLARLVAAVFCVGVALTFLWRVAGWQNSIRSLMGLEPVESGHPLKVCLIALLVFVVALILGRMFNGIMGWLARQAARVVPRRVANVLGASAAVFLFWALANDVLARTALRILDSSFKAYDALIEPERQRPEAASKTGSPASLVRWTELGRAGREFVASGPSAAHIGAVTGKPAEEPIRVYVGLRAADTPEARARLALEELKRVKAFDRPVLVVVTPTGTGWVDPSAIDSLEYLHHGATASVAIQYSYLNSPLSLLVQPEYGSEAAQALFAEIYDYWTALPKDRRPRLYLHGLSLGAFNSQKSADLFRMIGDPIQGALWSGPPFGSRLWRSFTDGRNPGSPAWLPEFRDGSFVRFMNQDGSRVPADTPWGAMRLVYLQYASDGVTFFDFNDFFRSPAWLKLPRGPDVSPDLRWYPIVTALQIALDMAVATAPPIGFGHSYAPKHYVEAWMAVTDVRDWSGDAVARLKHHLSEAAAREIETQGDEGAYDNRGG